MPYQTGIDENTELPDDFKLLNNYPNPFNVSTIIQYALTEPLDVSLEIFDILGRRIETITANNQSAGDHTITWNAESHASGVYFYKLTAGSFEQTRKMMLLK